VLCNCVLRLVLSNVTVFCTNCFIFSNICDTLSTQINAVKVENSFMNPVVVLLSLNYCTLTLMLPSEINSKVFQLNDDLRPLLLNFLAPQNFFIFHKMLNLQSKYSFFSQTYRACHLSLLKSQVLAAAESASLGNSIIGQ